MIKWPEPVLHQYRWTNPDGESQPASMLEWKDVAPAWNQTITQKCNELLAYRYKLEPVYEVRSLVTLESAKQTVRDALEEAAKRCKAEAEGRGDEDAFMATLCEERIRALIKEIPE